MKIAFASLLVVAAAFRSIPAAATTCVAKKIKVKHACGIVVDGSGVPILGATLQLVSGEAEPLTPQVVTQSDGWFSLDTAPAGDFFLAISAPQHNNIRWPLKITGKAKRGQCNKPLKVHLAGPVGWACNDWVDQK